MKIEVKEVTKVENILKTGKLGEKPMTSVNLMVRYYKNLGKEKEEIYNLLDEFLSKNLSSYNKVIWDERLQNVINSTYEVELCEIESVKITRYEIEQIKGVKLKYQKILFSLLIYLKLLRTKNKSETVYINATKYITDIFNEANVSSSKDVRLQELKELEELGYIEKTVNRRMSNGKLTLSMMIKLLYIKEENSDNPAELVVNDFRELGLQWLEYCGDNKIKCCEVCGKRYKIKSSKDTSSKYCKECKEEKQKESKREYWHKNK